MENEDVDDRIQRQIVVAQAQLDAQRRRGENADGTLLLLRCLRLSLRAFSGGIDPDDEAATTFVLSLSSDRTMFLRRDHHLARLDGAWLTSLFRNAGVVLLPGQALLVEPEFARRAVEDSLGESCAAERALEKTRAELQTALKQSSGPWKVHLLRELCRVDLEFAELPVHRRELVALHVTAQQMSRDSRTTDAGIEAA